MVEAKGAFLADHTTATGVRLVNMAYSPGTTLVRTDCPDLQLWWVVRGGWTLEKAGSSTELAVARASVHPPREPCRQQVAPGGASLLSVQLPPAYLPPKTELEKVGLGMALARLQTALWGGDELEREEALPRSLPPTTPRPPPSGRWMIGRKFSVSTSRPRNLPGFSLSTWRNFWCEPTAILRW